MLPGQGTTVESISCVCVNIVRWICPGAVTTVPVGRTMYMEGKEDGTQEQKTNVFDRLSGESQKN